MDLEINVIANSMVEPGGMSGGNKIFIELVKRWMNHGVIVNIFTSDAGKQTCELNGLGNANFFTWDSSRYIKFGIIPLYFLGTIKGILMGINKDDSSRNTIIFSTSDFWPDVVPGLIMNKKVKNTLWVSSFQLFMPHPFSSTSPYRGWSFKGLMYYISQLFSYRLVKKYANIVVVFGEYDVEKFITKKRKREKVIAIGGGVDTKEHLSVQAPKEGVYAAVFMGRLHPTKGVIELIDIWKFVCEKREEAKLAIIGHGELEAEIKERIIDHGLESNITLFGFKDGSEKIRIFKESKIILYPAILDHWSISPVEGMICGLPLVTFDLPSLNFYPTAKGMVRVQLFDLKEFANNIIRLLNDDDLYDKMQKDAVKWAKEWDWDKNAEKILKCIEGELCDK